jgi:dihydrofolate reductase
MMRKLVVLSFISLDGVMQGPGGSEEDPAGGFTHGGWVVPYFDDFLGKVMVKQMSGPHELLLGRKTYEIFAAHWPYVKTEDPFAAGLNAAKKYVASRTMKKLDWNNSELLKGDVVKEVKRLKERDGPEMQVHGSSDLIQTLLKRDLVDELWLKIFPVVLGVGKRLFAGGAIPVGFRLVESSISPSSVIVANFARAGEVKKGTTEFNTPTKAELERRRKLSKEERQGKGRHKRN